MSNEFEDIVITDLDVDRTRPSDSAGLAMRHMFLRLSERPPSEWTQLFLEERKFPRHGMWRRAWIEGRFVVVDCVPEEVEQYHLADLKQDVANANAKFRSYLVQVDAEAKRREEQQNRERDELQGLKKKLSFD